MKTCIRCGAELQREPYAGPYGDVYLCPNQDCGMMVSREDYDFFATMAVHECEHCHGTGYIAVERSLTAEPARDYRTTH